MQNHQRVVVNRTQILELVLEALNSVESHRNTTEAISRNTANSISISIQNPKVVACQIPSKLERVLTIQENRAHIQRETATARQPLAALSAVPLVSECLIYAYRIISPYLR